MSRVLSAPSQRHFPVKNNARSTKITVSADGRGLVSQAGAVLLWETLRVTGLGRGLSAALERWRAPRAVHDPGKIIADLAASVALGGDCLADIAVLREQPGLAGPVASDPVVSRLVTALAADAPRALKAIRAARATARERAWALAGDAAPGGMVTVDLDATIVTAHSEKEQAAPTWKKTFGFHPMTAWADHGPDGSGEPLAFVLRPGNAGSNTATDHIEATRVALAQLPRQLRRKALIRADTAGGTHEFLTWLTAPGRRACLLGRVHHHRGHPGRHPQDPRRRMDSCLRRGQRGPRRRMGRGDHRHAEPGRLACRDAGHRPERAAASRRAAAVYPTSTVTGSPPSPPAPQADSYPTWNYATGAGLGARTGSAAPRTPVSGNCPSRASRRTRSDARSWPWPANCSRGCR